VDRHGNDLLRLACRLCATRADAEDTVQETLLAAFRGIGGFDGRASLLTWMSRILVRRASKLTHRRRRDRAVSLDGLPEQPLTNRPSTVRDVDCRLDLATALPRLAHEHREVIVLRELQGMSYSEIATTLDIPQGTVESRLHRARRGLRQLLSAYRG
jgi:RNA polymerase sigma-70 factor (ECF subfamily)